MVIEIHEKKGLGVLFEKFKIAVYAVWKWSNGDIYKGSWKNWLKHGWGSSQLRKQNEKSYHIH